MKTVSGGTVINYTIAFAAKTFKLYTGHGQMYMVMQHVNHIYHQFLAICFNPFHDFYDNY